MCKIHWQIWRIHLSTPTNHDPIRHSSFEKGHSCIPIGSMYGICTNIYHNFKHGSYGILCLTSLDKSWRLQKGYDIPTICNHLHDITVISWQLVLGGWLNQTHPILTKDMFVKWQNFTSWNPQVSGLFQNKMIETTTWNVFYARYGTYPNAVTLHLIIPAIWPLRQLPSGLRLRYGSGHVQRNSARNMFFSEQKLGCEHLDFFHNLRIP